MTPLSEIIRLSNLYGSDADMVLAGGGNTSVKVDGVLYVKASGTRLGTIDESGFVALSMDALLKTTTKVYSDDEDEAEAAVLSDLMDSRIKGQTGRPSVEALLHGLFPQQYVVHLHPAMVNGLTCGQDAKKGFDRVFGDTAVWIDEGKPGYTLALAANRAIEAYKKENGAPPELMVIQNHGIFYAADTPARVEEHIAEVKKRLTAEIKRFPDFSAEEVDASAAAELMPVVRALCGAAVARFYTNKEVRRLSQSITALAPVDGAFSPDHIVYCGHRPCFASKGAEEAAIKNYIAEYGNAPKTVVFEGLGAVALGGSPAEAETAMLLFLDSVKVSVYAESFGGGRFMVPWMVEFIRSWEVEKYRSGLAKPAAAGRMAGKITVVTGGAQGFGAGLAREAMAQGALCIVADTNGPGAEAQAEALCAEFGAGRAVAVTCDVSDETSVQNLCERAALAFGGIDVFVSNAGILRSGGLEDMDFATFELMTRVNYSAFFLCVKHASRVMKAEHKYNPEKHFDIIQINSKSGLSGSNKNFAYAGGKFGGIGLVQSFALELVSDNIKVNAICPGNLLDGPLWSDPEKGLFVQYLRAGKIPGARTVEDVRKAYEDKVPMKKGCTVEDVAKAMFYAIEQTYETGQAIPVTGGQNMLR